MPLVTSVLSPMFKYTKYSLIFRMQEWSSGQNTWQSASILGLESSSVTFKMNFFSFQFSNYELQGKRIYVCKFNYRRILSQILSVPMVQWLGYSTVMEQARVRFLPSHIFFCSNISFLLSYYELPGTIDTACNNSTIVYY